MVQTPDNILRQSGLEPPGPPGSPEWGQWVARLMLEFDDYRQDGQATRTGSNIPLSLDDFNRREAALRGLLDQYPDLMEGLIVDNFGPDESDLALGALQALASGLSGAAQARVTGIVTSIKNRILRNEQINIVSGENLRTTRDITRTGKFRTEQDITAQRTRTRFIDVPTAEEVLNDFETGLRAFATNLQRTGQIDFRTADFMLQNQNLFLDGFLTDLVRRAEAGEDIFRVVGADGKPRFIGTRFGGQETLRESIREIERGKLTETEREITEGTRTRDTTTGERTRGTEERGVQTTREGGGREDRLERITEDTDFGSVQELEERLRNEGFTEEEIASEIERFTQRRSTERVTEEIFERPNLTTVFANSPLDFLRSQFSPKSLSLMAAGQRGRRQRLAETATGGFVSTPRRTF